MVTRVRKSGQADVLYAVGRAKKWNIRPQCLRVTGQFTDDDTLKIDFGNGVRAIYDFFDDFVNGQYISSGGTTRGQVKKVK